ncbi:MAG: UDP-N-acetyl-D-glucosamine 6-dehydrogenase [Gammaproteobacteria bacterium]|nr:UDP-N-acetyl-D-glucosamine 6-dehydrogenase [Gammaproteobacteria bacterium]
MSHKRKVSVVGLGYVGLPVAVEFGKNERVIGFDINARRIAELKEGVDHTGEVSSRDLKAADVHYTCEPGDLKQADFHIVAVPTPVDDAKRPDLTPVIKASETVGRILKKGDIVVFESTVYPGATEEDCVPVLERESGLKCGKDFFVGYSPERINPGDKVHTFKTITKVVSGQNPTILEIVAAVYGSVVTAGVHKAPSIKAAEAAKVIENTQRDLNIALMNELALIFRKMGIDTRDVLEAAGTKWNFLKFEPGLVGGHCIGVDPYYLTHKAAIMGYIPQVILSGRRINDDMGQYVASEVVKELIHQGKGIKGSTVTVLGLTFKENVPDLRNTRVVDIVKELKDYSINVQVHDPMVEPEEAVEEYGIQVVPRNRLKPADAVVFAVAHQDFVDEGWLLVKSLLKGGKGVVADVKGRLPRARVPAGISLWRL